MRHSWVNAAEVPRFYPNLVTLQDGESDRAEQLATIDILKASNLPGRWAVKDSFGALDLTRRGFDVLLEAAWIRASMPVGDASSDIEWRRETEAPGVWPFDDPSFAMFKGRRGFGVVASEVKQLAAQTAKATEQIGTQIDAIHASLRDDGVWLLVDIKALDTFEENAKKNPMASLMYGISVLSCMSSALSEPDGEGLGTLGLSERKAKEMAEAAGFTGFRRLDVDR